MERELDVYDLVARLRADDTNVDDCLNAATQIEQLRSKCEMLTNLACKHSWLLAQYLSTGGDYECDNYGQKVIYTGEYEEGHGE